MNQTQTLETLKTYSPYTTTDARYKERCLALVEGHDNYYQRNLISGHLTCSAWIVNVDRSKVILVHHRKLNQWLQPGGHIEVDDENLAQAALREAQEETGLGSLKLVSEAIFDLDIHDIPQHQSTPAHEHYDVRFLMEADELEKITINAESNNIGWFLLEDISQMNEDVSVTRMVEKTRLLS